VGHLQLLLALMKAGDWEHALLMLDWLRVCGDKCCYCLITCFHCLKCKTLVKAEGCCWPVKGLVKPPGERLANLVKCMVEPLVKLAFSKPGPWSLGSANLGQTCLAHWDPSSQRHCHQHMQCWHDQSAC
jgi:hypothetical protein